MLYKLYYELDNGYQFIGIWTVVFTQFPLRDESEVKVFLHKFVHKASDECVRRVYKIECLTYSGNNEVILQKMEY